jgi:hypothetical protein
MSATTAKDDSHSVLDSLKKQEAEIAAKIKEATGALLEGLHKKLAAAHEEVQSITKKIHELSGKPAPMRRGRKPGSKNKSTGSAEKKTKTTKKGKRGAVGAAIRAFVEKAGKSGAKVSDIAAATGNKPANVTAFFYAKGNAKQFKKVAPATFALK